MATAVNPQSPPAYGAQAPVVATAARYYRATRYIMVLLVLGCGVWFIKDGFSTWPEEQRQNEEVIEANKSLPVERQKKPPFSIHTETDIGLQKALGVGLPPVAVLILCWALYNSRGAYRLAGTTLSVPGHPSIDLSQITRIDDHLWDKKGIAYFHYSANGGGERKIRLDDFIYNREPTDEIYHRVEQFVNGEAGGETEESGEEGSVATA